MILDNNEDVFDDDEDETSKPRAKQIMRIEVVHDIASMGAT